MLWGATGLFLENIVRDYLRAVEIRLRGFIYQQIHPGSAVCAAAGSIFKSGAVFKTISPAVLYCYMRCSR